MPFINIYLPENYSRELKKKISHSVHESLIEIFNIPENDYFQVIHPVSPENLMFPDRYLGISHSPDLIYIHIICGSGRTVERKELLYSVIVHKISGRTHISENDIIIVLNETPLENWSFGQGKAQMINGSYDFTSTDQ